jgi:hypothetical protein
MNQNHCTKIDDLMPPRTIARDTVTVKPVFLTDEKVRANEVDSVRLPQGARVASLEESAAYYRSNGSFRDDLCRNGAAWTNKIGLETKGLQEIDAKGSFKGINEDRFYGELAKSPQNRSWHYSGNGRVAVGGFFWDGALCVIAVRVRNRARVAYVKDETS